MVCAEDTRVTGKLLAAFGIGKRLERLDEALIGSRADGIVARVEAGEVIAYCSDAGMPGVSDPACAWCAHAGRQARRWRCCPGLPPPPQRTWPAAVRIRASISAVSSAQGRGAEGGARCGAHVGCGAYLLRKPEPHRRGAGGVGQAFPLREAAVCRELTKLHEEVVRDTLPALRDEFAAREAAGGIKGEIVVVIDGPSEAEGAGCSGKRRGSARVRAAQLKAEGARNKDIAKTLAAEFGLPRNAAYEIALEA